MAAILVVDDRPTNRQFLVTLLGYAGHRLIEAADGAEALELARVERPDLVITDILMPTMDGYEFVRSLRADARIASTPVIFYSAAYSAAEAEALGKSCGVKTVLSKPSEPQAILDAVNGELNPRSHDSGSESRSTRRHHSQELDPARMSSHPFTGSIHRPQGPADRLAALEELSGRLIAERSPGAMLELFVAGAALVLGARRAAVCLLDSREQAVAHLAATGLDRETLRSSALDRTSLPGALLRAPEPVRLDSFEDRAARPRPGSPTAGSFLGLPIRAGAQVLGWTYFAEKDGGKPFDDDDERLALSMAARVAVVYENATLYETVQRHAAQLQLAVTERDRSEADLRESEKRFRQMAENVVEVFFLTDVGATEMYYVSPAYEAIWGVSCKSLYERPRSWSDAIHPEDRERASGVFAEMETVGGFDLEYRIVRPDGGLRWIRVRGFPIRDESGKIYRVAGIATDVTETKEAEIELRRTNRALTMLSDCNEALIRTKEENQLLNRICRIAVEVGGYRNAMVIYALHDEARSLVLKAHAGDTPDLFDLPLRSWAPEGQELGPAGRAIGSGEVIVVPDLVDDPALRPLEPRIREAGLSSGIVLPLINGDEALGVLALYTAPATVVSEHELRLLRELAADLAFGIGTIRSSVERQKAEDALVASLRDKEALLKEVHHRVKNNLQVITSLLRLESKRIEEGPTQAVLKTMQNRIQSMAALHETLYRTGNFAQVDLAVYLRQLAGQLIRTLVTNPDRITVQLDLVSVDLALDQAIPCGLIVNELVSNALKHGFPEARAGEVRVELRQTPPDRLLLRVSDDGVGLAADFEQRRSKSLGLQLVSDLARQLRGRLEVGPGTAFTVNFPGGEG
jgi:PAS domain S-box-containing protein